MLFNFQHSSGTFIDLLAHTYNKRGRIDKIDDQHLSKHKNNVTKKGTKIELLQHEETSMM